MTFPLPQQVVFVNGESHRSAELVSLNITATEGMDSSGPLAVRALIIYQDDGESRTVDADLLTSQYPHAEQVMLKIVNP